MAGHTTVQFIDALVLLSQPTGTTISELSRRLGVEKRQAYRIVDGLQDGWRIVLEKETSIEGIRYSATKESLKHSPPMILLKRLQNY